MAYADRQAARVIHAVIREIQAVNGEQVIAAWPDRTPQEQEQDTATVREHREKGVKARQAHEQWMAMRTAGGWTYGPVKDYAAKTTPLLVPYDDLPWEQRVKDEVYEALIPVLAGH